MTDERSVVWTWAMRGTLHFIATEDYWWLAPLTAETSLRGAHRRLSQMDVGEDQAAKAVLLIERILASEGPLTRAEIAERLSRRAIPTEGQAAHHLVRLAALEGVACYGPDRNGEPAFVLVRDWLGAGRSVGRDAALAELAARYLAAYGPTAPEDFVTWSGLRAADARQGWRAIARTLVEVRTAGSSLWMLPITEAAPGNRIVRLIPGFDPYLLGWTSRRFAVPERHERAVFPGGGMLRPTLIVDGLASGTWTARRRRDRLAVSVRPFSPLSRAIRTALSAESKDVGAFLETDAEVAME